MGRANASTKRQKPKLGGPPSRYVTCMSRSEPAGRRAQARACIETHAMHEATPTSTFNFGLVLSRNGHCKSLAHNLVPFSDLGQLAENYVRDGFERYPY